MMSWLMGLLLVCSGPLASGCDAACQLHMYEFLLPFRPVE